MDRLSPALKLVAQRELGETPQVRRDAVCQLRTLIAEEPELICPLDEEFLVKFLRSRKYRVQETLEIIRQYFRIRLECPDIFDDLLPSCVLFDAIFLRNNLMSFLTKPDSLGRRIAVIRPGAWNPTICPMNELLRAAVLLSEVSLLEQRIQIAGLVGVADFEGLRVSHLLHYTPSVLRKAVKLLQECYPVRMKAIYIVNNSPVFELIYAVLKVFLKPKLLKRIHFIGHDYDKLHELIPPESLPEVYGGTLENYEYEEFERSMRIKENYFEDLGRYGYREQRG